MIIRDLRKHRLNVFYPKAIRPIIFSEFTRNFLFLAFDFNSLWFPFDCVDLLCRDIFSEQLTPYKLDYGHLMENPSGWEERYERKNLKHHRHQGKVMWNSRKSIHFYPFRYITLMQCHIMSLLLSSNFFLKHAFPFTVHTQTHAFAVICKNEQNRIESSNTRYANVFEDGSYVAGAQKGNEDHFVQQHETAVAKLGIFRKRVNPHHQYVENSLSYTHASRLLHSTPPPPPLTHN